MNADDPRHGTESGYQKHRRDGEHSCSACTSAATTAGRMRRLIDTTGLTDGRWIPHGLIQIWEPDEPLNDGRARCGTDGGYYSHLRHAKTSPCWECRAAHAKAERDRLAAS